VAHDGVARNASLLKDVKTFICQEAQHSAEHASYNKKIQQIYHHDMAAVGRYARALKFTTDNIGDDNFHLSTLIDYFKIYFG